MIIGFDTETIGFREEGEENNFRLGTIYTETGKEHIYFSKNAMWDKILELGQQEEQKGKNLYAYAHNLWYDLSQIANLNDKNIEYYSFQPPIIQRKNIKFLDTTMLFKGSLVKMAQTIGEEKKEIPTKLLTKKTLTPQETTQMAEYCLQDAKIVVKGVQAIKKQLAKDGINIRTIITNGQIAINYATNHIRKQPYAKQILDENLAHWNWKRRNWGKWKETKNKEKLHYAYRGGRVQQLQTGEWEKATSIDLNSIYPYAASQTKFPQLETETLIHKPLEYMTTKQLTETTGASKALIWKPKDKLGYIPIRHKETIQTEEEENITMDEQIFPTQECTLIGTWTNQELAYFTEQGAKIKDVEYSIVYEDMEENPLKDIMETLYQKRLNAKTQFGKTFYKNVMNNLIGKFGQKNEQFTAKIDSVEKCQEYKEQGWQVANAMNLDYLYKKDLGTKYAKWYCPIICANTTAKARQILHQEMQKFKTKQLIYTDTDSILYTGNKPKNIKMGDGIGEWKTQHEDLPTIVYAKKAYSIGKDIKLSGASKAFLNLKDFKKGQVEYKRMKTAKEAETLLQIGEFKTIKTNLKQKQENDQIKQAMLNQIAWFTDSKEDKNIEYFITNQTLK